MFKKLNSIKYLILPILFACFLIISPSLASLKDGFSTSTTSNLGSFAKNSNYTEVQQPEYYIGLVLSGLFSLLGIIVVALIFYSGFVWMTARGNDAKVTKAKDNLIDALIGLLIVVGGYALTTFLLKLFT